MASKSFFAGSFTSSGLGSIEKSSPSASASSRASIELIRSGTVVFDILKLIRVFLRPRSRSFLSHCWSFVSGCFAVSSMLITLLSSLGTLVSSSSLLSAFCIVQPLSVFILMGIGLIPLSLARLTSIMQTASGTSFSAAFEASSKDVSFPAFIQVHSTTAISFIPSASFLLRRAGSS